MNDHRRQIDPIVIRLEKTVNDALAELKQWRMYHEKECAERFNKLDVLIKPLQDAFNVVDRPARYVGRVMVLLATGGLLWFGEKMAVWFARHFS